MGLGRKKRREGFAGSGKGCREMRAIGIKVDEKVGGLCRVWKGRKGMRAVWVRETEEAEGFCRLGGRGVEG